MNIQENVIQKIEGRQAIIAIIGLGYVGLPLTIAFAKAGFKVLGVDISVKRVESINRGESYIEDISSELLAEYTPNDNNDKVGSITATTDYDKLHNVDAVIICVPTPLSKTKDPDVSYIISATDEIAKRMHPGMIVVMESTTYPGSTEELILPRLQNANGQKFEVGKDFFLAFSPERIDPGREDWTVYNTPKVIGGVTPACKETARMLYASALKTVVPVSSPKVAEMVKLLENTFRAVNIALVNEMAIMCDKLGIDTWEVIEATKTKPFGYMPFYPGPGLGGHCIPIDPEYLAWKLRTLNYNARFIQLASEINIGMPHYVLDKITNALNDEGRAVKGAKILILGVTYKANIADMRESPALDIIHLLQEKGADVTYNDPYVPHLRIDGLSMDGVDLNETLLKQVDCVVITAAHNSYDWEWVATNSRLIVDTRNAISNEIAITTQTQVVKL